MDPSINNENIMIEELGEHLLDEQSANDNDGELKKEEVNLLPLLTYYLLPVLCVVLMLWYGMKWLEHRSVPKVIYDMEAMANHGRFQYKGSFSRDFNDLNDVQLAAAKRLGIAPIQGRDDIHKAAKHLTEIQSCDHYVIDKLTHSVPFLVPEAAQLVDEIGAQFVGMLRAKKLPLYRPIITSVTRTNEDMKSLRRHNTNASENSTHRFGTTFDISWKRFNKIDHNDPRDLDADELKHLLAIVLMEYKRDGRCYIKHERMQACFHITAIK